MKIFVAGASGAIGQPLIAAMVRHGNTVTGMSHGRHRYAEARRQGRDRGHYERIRWSRRGTSPAAIASRGRH
jgi:nucleoside-diphosphate-sugar epimerase